MIEFISEGQIKAKTEDEKQRMRQAAIAIDFYNGKQRTHMESVVTQLYPTTWEDVQKYIATSDLTRAIIDQKSILFLAPPEIELDFDMESVEGQPEPKLSPAQEATKERFEQMCKDAELWKKLIAVDRMANLTGKVGVCQHWHPTEKRVVIDIITPDKCHVITDENDPTKATTVYYIIGRDTDTRLASPVNVYAKWTAETYSEVQLNENFVEIKDCVLNQQAVKEGKESPVKSIPNIYGYIPIAWFSPLIEVDSFWVDHGYPLIEGNINVNLRESNLDIALDYQSFSTMVTKGLNKQDDIILGMTRRIDLPATDMGQQTGADAFYITPDAKLKDVSEIIQTKKTGIGKENGLSASAFNQDSSNITSGYQLRLTERQLEQDTELKKEIYRESIKFLCKNMVICYNAKSNPIIPPELEVEVYYVDKRFASNPIETATLHITKINAGLMSTADAIRENDPSLSQEDAIQEAIRIRTEQQTISGGIRAITAQDLDNI